MGANAASHLPRDSGKNLCPPALCWREVFCLLMMRRNANAKLFLSVEHKVPEITVKSHSCFWFVLARVEPTVPCGTWILSTTSAAKLRVSALVSGTLPDRVVSVFDSCRRISESSFLHRNVRTESSSCTERFISAAANNLRPPGPELSLSMSRLMRSRNYRRQHRRAKMQVAHCCKTGFELRAYPEVG
jgi:hypothetical protein